MSLEEKLEEMQKKLENHFFSGYQEKNLVLLADLVVDEKISRDKINSVIKLLKSKIFEGEPEELKGDIIELLKQKLDSDKFYNIYLITTPDHLLEHYYVPIKEIFYHYEKYKLDYYDSSYVYFDSDTGNNLGVGFVTSSRINISPDEIAQIIGNYDRKKAANVDHKYIRFTKQLFIINDTIRTKYVLKDLEYNVRDDDDEDSDKEEVENEVIMPIKWIWFFQISYKTLCLLFDP